MTTNALINICVTISGPGETFHREQYIIKQALLDAGYSVTVQDDYPLSPEVEANFISTPIDHRKSHTTHITLVADHCPWGG